MLFTLSATAVAGMAYQSLAKQELPFASYFLAMLLFKSAVLPQIVERSRSRMSPKAALDLRGGLKPWKMDDVPPAGPPIEYDSEGVMPPRVSPDHAGPKAINPQRANQLREALQELRHRHGVMYNVLAREIDIPEDELSKFLNGRSRMDEDRARKIYAYAVRKGLSLGGQLTDYQSAILMDMNIQTDDLIAKTQGLAGDYLLFVRNQNEIAVSCLSFYASSKSDVWPKFTSWRDGLTIKGYYFSKTDTIHLFGHASNIEHPRLITLWVDRAVAQFSHVGTMAATTSRDYAMFAFCCAIRTEAKELRDRNWDVLGSFPLDQAQVLHPAAHAYLAEKPPVVLPKPNTDI